MPNPVALILPQLGKEDYEWMSSSPVDTRPPMVGHVVVSSSLAFGITPTAWLLTLFHLSCFALRTDLPFPLVGRNPHDYYHDSVTIALSRLRPSHVPSRRNVRARRRLPTHGLQ
jgi:hypothetical protein